MSGDDRQVASRENLFHPPDPAILQPDLNAVGMAGGLVGQVFDDAAGQAPKVLAMKLTLLFKTSAFSDPKRRSTGPILLSNAVLYNAQVTGQCDRIYHNAMLWQP
jgi:hypothetical protein